MNGKQLNGWFRQNTKRHGTKTVSECPNVNIAIINFLERNRDAILLANDIGDESHKITVLEMNIFWGHLMYQLKKGCFDPTKMPIASRTLTFKNGKTIEEGERVKNQGQARVLEGYANIGAWRKSNTVYMAKPNGFENEMYKSTTGCGGLSATSRASALTLSVRNVKLYTVIRTGNLNVS